MKIHREVLDHFLAIARANLPAGSIQILNIMILTGQTELHQRELVELGVHKADVDRAGYALRSRNLCYFYRGRLQIKDEGLLRLMEQIQELRKMPEIIQSTPAAEVIGEVEKAPEVKTKKRGGKNGTEHNQPV